jgi:ribosomal protein S24E
MNTIKDFRNDLLKRREIKLVVEAEKNPGFENALKIVADGINAKEDLIVIREVKSKFGRNTFLIDAFVYDSADDRARIEPKKKEKKDKQAAAQAPAGGNK